MVWLINQGKLITGRKLSQQSEFTQLAPELDRIQNRKFTKTKFMFNTSK